MFEVPEAKASRAQDTFKFKIAGKAYSIKKAKFLTLGQSETLANPETATDVLDFFGKRGTAQGDAVRTLNQEQFEALVKAYTDDSGVSLGESEASSS